MSVRKNNDNLTLVASTAQTATSTGETEVSGMGGYAAIVFELDVTAAATDTADTLNLFIQVKDALGEWLDVVHFTEVLGDGGAKKYVTKIAVATVLTEYEVGAALGAAAVRNILGNTYRARWVIVDADADASFTFSVSAMGIAI